MNAVKSVKYNLIGGGLPFGCKISGGEIIPAFSAGEVNKSCPTDVWFAAFMRNSNRFFVISNIYSYTAEEDVGTYTIMAFEKADLPFAIEHKVGSENASEFVFNNRYIYYKGSGRYLIELAANIGGGVYKNGRVFGVDLSDRCKLRWSGEGGLEDWEEKIDGAGWLYTDAELGEIYRLYVLNGQIAALRKYGVSLVSAYGTPEEFKVTESIKTPLAYRECAAVCGDKLYIYTVDGMYAVNSSGARKIDIGLAEGFTSPTYAMAYGECVFFTGTHKGLEKKLILVYDTKEKSAYYIDLAANALCAGGYPYAYTSNGAVMLARGTSFTYESEVFGNFSNRTKTLESILLDCEKEVDVTVKTDRGTRLFKGVKGMVKTHIGGSFFKVTISGTDSKIKGLTANVEYY